MFAGQVRAFSIAHRNSDIFWKLNNTNRINIAVKIVTGDYKYVTTFFCQRLNARAVARDAVEEVMQKLPQKLGRMDVEVQSLEGYLALLKACRKKVSADQRAFGIEEATKDWALKEACWAVTCGADKSAAKLLAPRNQDKWGSVGSNKIEAALVAAKELPQSIDGNISGPDLLKLVGDHFEVFSGPIWSHKEASVSLEEYFGLASALHVLEKLVDKSIYTKKDVDLLKSTLKGQDSLQEEDNRPREFSFSGPSEKTEIEIDPDNPDETRSRMVEAVYEHYFGPESTMNLSCDKRRQFEEKYRGATNAMAKVEALKTGFNLTVENVLAKNRLVAIFDDLALMRRPAKMESLVIDDD